MANVSVTSTKSNITVNTTSNVVTVSSTPVNVVVSATSLISNASVRNAISIANLTGYGNLSYDNTLASNGVISYTGVSNSDINTYIVENIDTDDIDEGSANLYYTTARANSAISDYTGSLENLTGNITTTSNIAAGNVSATRTVEASLLNATGALGLTVTGNATIGGNLDVTGNINSETVVDLLVEDRNITLQYSNVDTAPTSNSQIFIDRGTSANTYLIWSEADDKWGFSNDGTNVTFLAETTDDLTEGTTNLYYSNAKVTNHLLSFDNNILPDTDLAYSLGNGPYRWSNIHVANAVVKSIWGEPFPGDDTIRLRDQAIFYGAALPEGNASTGQSLGSNTAVWGQLFSNTIQTNGIVSDGTRLKHSNATPIVRVGSDAVNMSEDTSLSILGNVLYLNDSNINTNTSIVFSNVGVAMGTSATDNTFRISTWTDSTGIIDSVSPNYEIDFDGDKTTITDQSIELRGNVQMGSGGYTLSGGTAGGFGSGNIEWSSGNINAAYFHGDGSNITGIAGDIEGVTAGSGLTGGGTTGTVTLNVGEGTGILANPDNVSVDMSAFTTEDLAEGTNLYFTNARANAAFVDSLDNITTDISSNSNITTTGFFVGDLDGAVVTDVYNDTGSTLNKGDAVYLTGGNNGDNPHVALADADDATKMPALGIIRENISTASVGQVVTSGVMNDSSHGYTLGADLFISTTAGALSETAPTSESGLIQKIGKVVSANHIIVQGAFRTNQTPNLDEGNIFLGSSSNTAIAVAPDSNFDTTGNTFSLSNTLSDVNNIASETGANLNLKGQADGIHFDTTIDSTESRIVDLDTTGYSVADVELPADFTAGTNTPSFLISGNFTAGSPLVSVNDIFGGAGGSVDVAALRGPGFSSAFAPGTPGDLIVTADISSPFPGAANIEAAVTTTGVNFAATGANGLSNVSAGLYGQDAGWGVFDLTTSSTTTLFPANAYVVSMSGGVITMSENALIGAIGRTAILSPGMAQTSDSKTTVKYYANTHTGSNSEFISNYGKLSNFDNPESLSNTTFDAISYGNTSSVTTTVTMKNISDFAGTDESATRFKRGLLIGAATTPDPVSGRSTLNQPSTLGVILESDGESFNDGLNTPAPRFLINNYSGGLDDLTNYPVWGQVGATGNLTLDLPQIKAPSLTLKSFRGAKSTANTTSYLMQSGDVVGKIAFSPAQTTGTGNQGVDGVNPPAAITVDVGSANIANVANAYMHITTTPPPGTNIGYMRNNASDANGANQQTNFTTKGGNLTLAAQTSGMISLAPTPDYGDAANSTVWTRYPGTTHEYHRFMDVGFLDKTNKNGTIITIQPASGTTSGSGGLGYDSKGNATLRFQTHLANSDARYNFDIVHDESNEKLIIESGLSNQEHISIESGGRVSMKQVMNLNPLSNSAILALGGNSAGDVVYGSDVNKVCYYNGTSWKTIDDNTDIV